MGQTLGQLVQRGKRIRVRCIACRREALLDPAPLAERFGEDAPLIEDSPLYSTLICSACGKRLFSIESVWE